MSGSIIVARSIFEDAAFKREMFSEREAWLWMLMDAAWKGRERRIADTTITLKRGQLAGSIRFWAEAWGWSKSRVHRYLERLEKRSMVVLESGTGVTVITICKYDKFQRSGTAAGQQRDSSGTNLITENKGKRDTNVSLYTSDFEDFWNQYPRKIEKKAAAIAYEKAIKIDTHENIIAGVLRYSNEVHGKETKYIKHASGWLNQERWNDEYRPDPTPQPNGQSPDSGRIIRLAVAASQLDET